MQGVIERRRAYLLLMRRITLEKGYFTVQEIQKEAGVPRSTAQDWILRLTTEGCVVLQEPPRGRMPARYAAVSALPRTACRRIFTAVEEDLVEIVHECLSSSCAAFCGHHHNLGCGGEMEVDRDGSLLREYLRIGDHQTSVGLYPHSAVAITGVFHEGDEIIQRIRSVGGPAFSVSAMMGRARGVLGIDVIRDGHCTIGLIRTKALTHVTIGMDNTDSCDDGATFALAIALLQHLGSFSGVFPICHHVAMLYPGVPEKTAGNSASSIELAVDPESLDQIITEAVRFVADESVSPAWGVAIRTGIWIPDSLREYGLKARSGIVSRTETDQTASRFGVITAGSDGITGALAALSLSRCPVSLLLDPKRDPGPGSRSLSVPLQ